MENLEKKVNQIDKKADLSAQKLDIHCKQNDLDLTEIKNLLKDALIEKANKWVEKFVYALIVGGSLYFIYKLIDLLDK